MCGRIECRSAAVSLEGWVGRYADRRYGAQIPAAAKQLTAAWQILRQTAYNGSDGEMVSKDTVTAIPYGRPWDKVDGTDNPRSNQSAYDDVLFLGAWKGLLAAAGAGCCAELTDCAPSALLLSFGTKMAGAATAAVAHITALG